MDIEEAKKFARKKHECVVIREGEAFDSIIDRVKALHALCCEEGDITHEELKQWTAAIFNFLGGFLHMCGTPERAKIQSDILVKSFRATLETIIKEEWRE